MKRFAAIFILILLQGGLNAQVLIDPYILSSPVGNDLLDGLQAYWKFDELSGNPQDSSGNARHLTESGTVDSDLVGVINAARFHDASESDDFFSVADGAWNEFGTNDFTITFWYKPQAGDLGSINDHMFVTKGDSVTGNSYLIGIDRGGYPFDFAFKFYYDEDGTTGPVPNELLSLEVGADFSTDFWFFVYVVRSGNNFTLGYAREDAATLSLTDTATQAISFFDATGPYVVGSWLASGVPVPSHDTEGSIDEMGVWNVAKSSCQLLKLFRLMPYGLFDSNPCL